MALLACECPSPFNLLITFSFDLDCMCSLNTDWGMHLTSWPDSRGCENVHHSKSTVFVLQSFACTAHSISFCSALKLALVIIIWYLVLHLHFLRAYLTFPKAVVVILKHTTSLHVSMYYVPALIQAELDYWKADVDQKIQQHITTSQTQSADLDRAFIMGIEIGLSILVSVKLYKAWAFISDFRCDKCVYIRGIVGWNSFWNWHSHTQHKGDMVNGQWLWEYL